MPKRPGELSTSRAQRSVPVIPPDPKPPEQCPISQSNGTATTTETTEPNETSEPLEPRETTDSSKTNCVESNDPFEFPTEGLLIANGHVNGTKARILIDSGAVLNHISAEFCQRNNIKTQEETSHVGVMANKVEQSLRSTVSDVQISIGSYTEKMRLVANPQNHDVILGKKWCSNHKALLDCDTNEIIFCHKNSKHKIHAVPQVPMKEVNANCITKDFKVGCPMYTAILREPRDDSTNKQHPDVEVLLTKYKDVFPDELPDGLPPKRPQGDFKIELKEGSKPIKRGLYRMSLTELEETKTQVEKLMKQGFVRPSTSPWAAPVLFASKKDGGLRFCVDYRAINKMTNKNSYPLPRVDGLLDEVGQAQYFSVIDLRSGYHQIRIAEEDIPKTAFNTRYGHYEYTVVPFGLTNAPAAFMTIMNDVFQDYVDKFVCCYLDDILIYSESWEQHMKHIELVLQRLRQVKLYAKLSKCVFGTQEVEYLGFILKAGKLAMNRNKTNAIEVWETPTSKKELQSFLGLVNYYRRFIKNCSKITKPLTELTKNVPFVWTDKTEAAFQELKRTVTSAPVLRQFDKKLPIYITTDASKYAIGGVMEQDFSDGRHPIAFVSRTLNQSEQNYAAHDLELLGIYDTIRMWRCYLHGRKFTIHTDHHPLRYLETQEFLSPRQVRWLEKLAQYDFTIAPIKGKSNQVADGLSRQKFPGKEDSNYGRELLGKLMQKTTLVAALSILEPGSDLSNKLIEGYKEDPEFRDIYENPSDPYEIKDGLLYRQSKLCIPRGEVRKSILHDYHSTPSSGHLGESKTRNRIYPLYYWKGLRNSVHEFVKTCRTCQQTKSRNHKPYGFLQPIDPPNTKWQVLTMDFIAPLPKTKQGFSGIMTIVCKLSKMIRLIPIKHNMSAPEIAAKFKEVIYRNHGLPKKIISDRDPIFMSKFWQTLFKSLGTKLAPSTAYHPQTDGQSEIANRKVEEMIRAFANFSKDNWDEHLVDFEVAYNSATNSTTLCSPFYINYGLHPRIVPVEALATSNPSVKEFLKNMQEVSKFAFDRIKQQNEKMAAYANKFRKQHVFKVNDKVLLSTKNLSLEDGSGSRKLNPKFCGPFKIIEQVTNVSFRLELSEPMKAKGIHNTFHVSLLKPFYEDKFDRYDHPLPPINIEDGVEFFEVEAILASRTRRGKQEYLIKWKGYPDSDNQWYPREDLAQDIPEQLEAFEASRRRSSRRGGVEAPT